MKSHPVDDSPDHFIYERRKIPCPRCGNWMADTSTFCAECQGEIRGQQLSREWWEKHLPDMLARHRRVKEIMATGYLTALVALEVARREWGEL